MITFGTLALEAYFSLPGGSLCYRKISDTQAVCFPQNHPQFVRFTSDEVVEHAWQREQINGN